MTLSRTLFWIVLLTFSVFLYAHGQISKTIILYEMRHDQEDQIDLWDTHRLLNFQVSELTSPPSLERALAKGNLPMEFPESRRIIRLAMGEETGSVPRKKTLLDRLSVTKVAEATLR